MNRWLCSLTHTVPCLAALLFLATLSAFPGEPASAPGQDELLIDGSFEAISSGNQLRNRRTDRKGWYESRRDKRNGESGRKFLKLSTKPIGGNETHKAMIKASPEFNTYLSQSFSGPQDGRFSLKWDIYVKEILPPFNRSAFQMIGNASVKGRGPNGAGPERFVFLAFENAAAPGKLDLFAFEGISPEKWDQRTLVVSNLDIKKWHTIVVDVNVPKKVYFVSVPGVTTEPVRLRAFKSKKKSVPEVLTHISFASWDDGPGTFYVDNVGRPDS
ncbi:MAG: hypothetical protein KAY24_07810 [Candidatus Eisenbacteria sp.]|nr:hypothetical protein [Candidatus Eisenbacteria bacterium]